MKKSWNDLKVGDSIFYHDEDGSDVGYISEKSPEGVVLHLFYQEENEKKFFKRTKSKFKYSPEIYPKEDYNKYYFYGLEHPEVFMMIFDWELFKKKYRKGF